MGLTKIRAGQISDIDYKQSARVLTDTNINLSGGAPLVVDGVTLLDIDRVLVKGQTNAAQNGIYRVLIPGTGSNGTWVRSSDANENGEIEAGMIIMVTEGTVYKDTQWKLITNDPIIIGTTPLIFEQNSAFAFGNIYANGTAVLANTVGDTLTVTPSNNISLIGNASTKTLTVGVVASGSNSQIQYNVNGNLAASSKLTYIDGNGVFVNPGNVTANYFFGDGSGLTNIAAAAGTRIEFGTSNVAIAESNGVANITIDGTANIVIVDQQGLETFGNITANNYVGYANVIRLYGTEVIVVDDNTTNAPGNLVATNLHVNTIRSDDSTFVEINDGLSTDEIVVSGNVTADGIVALGNVTANGLTALGNVSGTYFLGNGALLTGIDTTLISNGNSSVQVITSGGNIVANVAGNTVLVISTDGLDLTGNLIATANVDAQDMSAQGNVTANGITALGNVSGTYFLGNGALLTGIDTTLISNGNSSVQVVTAGGNIVANVAGNTVLTITTDGLDVDGNVAATGNVSGDYILANGRFLTGLVSVAAFNNIIPQESFPGEVTTANNVPANTSGDLYFVGGQGIDISTDPANLRVTFSVADDNLDYELVIDPVTVSNNLGLITATATSEFNYGPVATYGGLFVSHGGVLANGVINSNSSINSLGNITSNGYFIGNGAFLTGTITGPAGNDTELQFNNAGVLGASSNLTWDGSELGITGDIYISAVANIGGVLEVAKVGSDLVPEIDILYDLGNTTNRWRDLYLSGNTIYLGDAEISANATAITFTGPEGAEFLVSGNSSSNTTMSVGTITATGNITGGNLVTAGAMTGTTLSVSSTANVTTLNVSGATTLTGNAGIGNLSASGVIGATGNITGGNLISTGSLNATGNANVGNIGAINANLTAITATGNANLGNIGSAGLMVATGNVTGGNLTTTGIVDAVGNVLGGNIVTWGAVEATGNASGENILANTAIYVASVLLSDVSSSNLQIAPASNITLIGPNNSVTHTIIPGITPASSTTSGALQVRGGASVVGNLYVGSAIIALGDISGEDVFLTGEVAANGNVTAANIVANAAVYDSKGEIRSVPRNLQTTAYTLVASDAGKFISSNANVTVPNGVFSAGESISVYNNSAANITIVQSTGVTMYNVGTDSTGNRTLAQRGLATIFCTDANAFVITGGGVS